MRRRRLKNISIRKKQKGGCAVRVHMIYFIMIIQFVGIQFCYLHELESVSEMEQEIAKKEKANPNESPSLLNFIFCISSELSHVVMLRIAGYSQVTLQTPGALGQLCKRAVQDGQSIMGRNHFQISSCEYEKFIETFALCVLILILCKMGILSE